MFQITDLFSLCIYTLMIRMATDGNAWTITSRVLNRKLFLR